jgi:hypothetical protein
MPLPLSQYLAAVQASMGSPGAIDLDTDPAVVGHADAIDLDAPAKQAAVPPGIDPSWLQPKAAPPARGMHTIAAPSGADESPGYLGLSTYAEHLRPMPPPGGAPAPDAAPAAPTAAPAPGPTAGPTPADAGPQAPEHPFPLTGVGGAGVIPAHEQDLRGPSLKGAQGNYNDAVAGAIDAGTMAHGMGAGREYALALEQERAAHEREMAAEQAMAERQEEMAQKEQDFSTSAKALGQFAFKPDGGFWESRTTGQKIAGMFSLALNGFMAGVGRPVPDIIGQRIEQSIRAQENAYHALKDTANAQQNAFGLAMQKYGNEDAARAHVRVAAIEGLQAQAAQVMALNKGTEIGAKAAAAYADLEGQKMQQIQMGIRFLPAQATGRRFVDQNTGLVYTEQEAKALAGKWYDQGFKREEIGLNTAGDIMKEGAKAGRERDAYGPMGKAGSEKLATEQAASQKEQDAILRSINRAQSNVDSIVAGGPVGNAYANAVPASAPFATGAMTRQIDRETYNRKVMTAVAAAYKLSTDATEPKRKEMLEHFAEPYTIRPSDNREVAIVKMGALKKLVEEGAASKGAEPESRNLPASVTFHGGK